MAIPASLHSLLF